LGMRLVVLENKWRCREEMAAAGAANKIHCHERTGRCEHRQGAAGTGKSGEAGTAARRTVQRGSQAGKIAGRVVFGLFVLVWGHKKGVEGAEASRQSKSDALSHTWEGKMAGAAPRWQAVAQTPKC
jgi:hypothetical protein